MMGRLGRLSLAAILFTSIALWQFDSAAHAVELCGKWDTVAVNGKEYVVQNNIWGANTAQCIDVDGTRFGVTRADHSMPTNGAPAAYPSIYQGCHWEDCTHNSGMPVRVSELGTATSSWSVSTISSGAWNVAYDLWFKTDSAPGAPDGAELMIWLNSRGGVQPAGSLVASNVPLAGATWNVWRAQMDWNYIAYQRTSPTNSVANFDLRAFVVDAANRGAIQPSWHFMTVEAGFELWQGGAGLVTESFSSTVSAGSGVPPSPSPSVSPSTSPSPSPSVSPPTGACSVSYIVRDQWSTGFTADVTVTNHGAPVNGWTLGFGFPGDQKLINGWSATWSQSGQAVTARSLSWNGNLATGASATVGFNGSHSGSNPKPTSFTLNGAACRVG